MNGERRSRPSVEQGEPDAKPGSLRVVADSHLDSGLCGGDGAGTFHCRNRLRAEALLQGALGLGEASGGGRLSFLSGVEP